MPRTWSTFDAALTWAKRHGREHCHACDMWQIVRHTNAYAGKLVGEYAIAIVSRNTGRTIAFVCPE